LVALREPRISRELDFRHPAILEIRIQKWNHKEISHSALDTILCTIASSVLGIPSVITPTATIPREKGEREIYSGY
jgi:hypothetical protein